MEWIKTNTEWIKGKKFAMTGGFGDVDHDYIDGLIREYGGYRHHNIYPDTDYCIWEERIFGSTEKVKKARQYNGHGSNIVIMTPDELRQKLAGEEITLSSRQSSKDFHRIADYVCAKDPEYVEKYLEEHDLKKPSSQTILMALLKKYNMVSFSAQRKWCDLIAETSELQYRLYKTAVIYFIRIAEYDKAVEICNLAIASAKPDELERITDYVEDLKVDIEFYRVNPYWPNTRMLKQELAEIYDSKGIIHPELVTKSAGYSAKTIAGFESGSEGSKKVFIKPSELLDDERIQEIRDAAESIDFSSNDDNKYRDFVSVGCFNIEGIGTNTIEMLLDGGWIQSYADVFRLKDKKEEILESGLFSDDRVEKMLTAIETAKTITDVKFLTALHISGLTEMVARAILDVYSLKEFLDHVKKHESIYDLVSVKGIGVENSARILSWFECEANVEILRDLMKEVTVTESNKDKGNSCEGLTFVVTGSVHVFKNRDALKNYIFAQGGKLSGSVSKSTSFLVNNDIESTSSKNKKAHALNVPIISEDEFIERFGFGEA